MMNRTFPALMFALLLLVGSPALAHNKYKVLTPGTPVDDAWTGNACWADATRNILGDSHHCLGSGDFFYKFHLDGPSLVTISVEGIAIPDAFVDLGLDPAFTLYKGLMSLEGHDDASFDPLNPVDDVNFLPMASRVDAAPPGHVYTPHDGFRDTLNYSTTGGLYTEDNDGGDPFNVGYPINPYAGQFDALGDWSMANAYGIPGQPTIPSACPVDECPDGNPVGDWATIYYVAHRNDHVGVGAVADTTAEVLQDEPLDAGDYTVIVGGGCPGCSAFGGFGGRITLAVTAAPGLSSDLLTGKKITLKTKVGAPTKSKLSLQSKDPAVTLGAGNGSADDPTSVGATVRVFSINGDFDELYDLPAANWALVGKPGEGKGYKYKDKTLAAGPIGSATITAGKLVKITGKGAGLGQSLTVSPAPLRVTLTLGGHRYCLQFGGVTKWKADQQFSAKEASAPVVCAP
ncbi:MAG TPA: hypothetical protein VMS22_12850 [Candidatus Eisenbacteria bacterium]|nr:hypothetical protein [Candidatus Eisenbacteria bacterium]